MKLFVIPKNDTYSTINPERHTQNQPVGWVVLWRAMDANTTVTIACGTNKICMWLVDLLNYMYTI